MLVLMRTEQAAAQMENRQNISDLRADMQTTVKNCVEAEIQQKLVPQMNLALEEARAARRIAEEAKQIAEADRQSVASIVTSSSGKSGKTLGPLSERKKMVVGGFEDNTEKHLCDCCDKGMAALT